jgi:bifunctional non-homologous end joining protein LigD
MPKARAIARYCGLKSYQKGGNILIKPMLCKTELKPFDDDNFIWERKYDGARIIAVVNGTEVKLFSRSGLEKTGLFPELRIETKLPAILDGEVVSGDSFNGIQHRVNRQNGISIASKAYPATFHVFDVLETDGVSLEREPLFRRKLLLAANLKETENVQAAPFTDRGTELFEQAKQEQWEGIIGKSRNGAYAQGKRVWKKVKLWLSGTFLAVGYTQGTGWRANLFGALVLSDTKGAYVGSVGTGFNDADIRALMRMFSPAPCPFPRDPEPATWIKPFAVKIRYMEYTNDGMLRFPSFKGVV